VIEQLRSIDFMLTVIENGNCKERLQAVDNVKVELAPAEQQRALQKLFLQFFVMLEKQFHDSTTHPRIIINEKDLCKQFTSLHPIVSVTHSPERLSLLFEWRGF
jgi:hypothetical protein